MTKTLAIIDIEEQTQFNLKFTEEAQNITKKYQLTKGMIRTLAYAVVKARFAHNACLKGLVNRKLAIAIGKLSARHRYDIGGMEGYVTTDQSGINGYQLTDLGAEVVESLFELDIETKQVKPVVKDGANYWTTS